MPDLPSSFDDFNEADIREEVIAPLLRKLGYRSGTQHNIVREQSLRYPRSFLGRRNPNKDPELRGRADYILEVDRLIRWIVEAKSPTAVIEIEDVEQAWTYANHPEIRAVYFVLCNGHLLQVYQTQHGPDAAPILTLKHTEFDACFASLSDVVGPSALLRDFPRCTPDTSPPIGPGLRSVVRISGGLITYDRNTWGEEILNELQATISGGAVERDEQGRLVAYLRSIMPLRSLQALSDRLGLSAFEMVSADSSLSVDQERPTRFHYSNAITFPAGERLLDIRTWQEVVLERNVRCEVEANADGSLTDRTFAGLFRSRTNYIDLDLAVTLEGRFTIHLT